MNERLSKLTPIPILTCALAILSGGCHSSETPAPDSGPVNDDEPVAEFSLQRVQQDTFRYLWETTNADNGLAPDRYPADSPSNIAAVGFALTSYPIGIEHGFISREQGAERTLATLRFLYSLPQGPAATGTAGYQGFFYRFLDMTTGLRMHEWDVELSTVDTALLMAGVLFAQTYFDADDPVEATIRSLADDIYGRVNWQWAQNNPPLITLGWNPDSGFLEHDWVGYNEAMIVYILALGSPTFPVEPEAWAGWADHYADDWGGDAPYEHLTFGPLFGHQFTHVWIDFRDIQDTFMAEKDSDYFLNSRIAVRAQQQYAITNPLDWDAYGRDTWGISASDGPGDFLLDYNGSVREFRGYSARGVALTHDFDDGTLTPMAVGASIPFAPEITIPALKAIYEQYGEYLYTKYGFLDSFNPSFRYNVTPETGKVVNGVGWIASDYLGIDQGPMFAMIENYRSELIWDTMKKNPYIRRGLLRAGFSGGWLEADE